MPEISPHVDNPASKSSHGSITPPNWLRDSYKELPQNSTPGERARDLLSQRQNTSSRRETYQEHTQRSQSLPPDFRIHEYEMQSRTVQTETLEQRAQSFIKDLKSHLGNQSQRAESPKSNIAFHNKIMQNMYAVLERKNSETIRGRRPMREANVTQHDRVQSEQRELDIRGELVQEKGLKDHPDSLSQHAESLTQNSATQTDEEQQMYETFEKRASMLTKQMNFDVGNVNTFPTRDIQISQKPEAYQIRDDLRNDISNILQQAKDKYPDANRREVLKDVVSKIDEYKMLMSERVQSSYKADLKPTKNAQEEVDKLFDPINDAMFRLGRTFKGKTTNTSDFASQWENFCKDEQKRDQHELESSNRPRL